MALLTWRERDPKGKEKGPVLYLDFDATLLEEFSRAANVTQFPVEDGSILSDHYQAQPRAITLEVQVSDTPTAPRPSRDGMDSSIGVPVGTVRDVQLDLPVNRAPVRGLVGQRVIRGNTSRFPTKRSAPVLQFDGDVYRTVDAFEKLDELMQTSQLVNVLLFGEVDIKNMVITNIRTPRDAQSGSTLTFSIDLLQVTFAKTELGEGEPSPSSPEHTPRGDAGQKNPTADHEATAKADAREYGWTE